MRHSTQFLGSAVNLLQTWNPQLEMDWAIFGKRVFLHQEHDFRTGQIVFDATVFRALVPAIKGLDGKDLLIKAAAYLVLLLRNIEQKLKIQIVHKAPPY